jgi:phosphoglycolate phosphatase-like HAD superfamily hydrolase
VTDDAAPARTARPLAIFDLDGTLADVAHRVHWLEGSRRNYPAFFSDAVDDPPLPTGVELLLESAKECEVAYVTGRPEWCRDDTWWWLQQHGLPLGRLAMREYGDHRPARIAKVELLAELARGRVIAVIVDDDEDVCNAYEAEGWPVLRATWASESRALHEAQEDDGRT